VIGIVKDNKYLPIKYEESEFREDNSKVKTPSQDSLSRDKLIAYKTTSHTIIHIIMMTPFQHMQHLTDALHATKCINIIFMK